jgi:hypothetical protein
MGEENSDDVSEVCFVRFNGNPQCTTYINATQETINIDNIPVGKRTHGRPTYVEKTFVGGEKQSTNHIE